MEFNSAFKGLIETVNIIAECLRTDCNSLGDKLKKKVFVKASRPNQMVQRLRRPFPASHKKNPVEVIICRLRRETGGLEGETNDKHLERRDENLKLNHMQEALMLRHP